MAVTFTKQPAGGHDNPRFYGKIGQQRNDEHIALAANSQIENVASARLAAFLWSRHVTRSFVAHIDCSESSRLTGVYPNLYVG